MWLLARERVGRRCGMAEEDSTSTAIGPADRGVRRLGSPGGLLSGSDAGSRWRALRERAGAQSVVLLESRATSIAAKSCRFRPAASCSTGSGTTRIRWRLRDRDFDAWLRWASNSGPSTSPRSSGSVRAALRMAVPLRTKHGGRRRAPAWRADGARQLHRRRQAAAAQLGGCLRADDRERAPDERALEQEKLRRDLALAAEVQRRLLPAAPPGSTRRDARGLHRCRRGPSAATTTTFSTSAAARIGIAVADVSGKGIAAALLMSVVQASLRVISARKSVPLSQLASRDERFPLSVDRRQQVRDILLRAARRGRRGSSRYVNAGHNPPFLVRASDGGGTVVELAAGGTVLGLFREVAYERRGRAAERAISWWHSPTA